MGARGHGGEGERVGGAGEGPAPKPTPAPFSPLAETDEAMYYSQLSPQLKARVRQQLERKGLDGADLFPALSREAQDTLMVRRGCQRHAFSCSWGQEGRWKAGQAGLPVLRTARPWTVAEQCFGHQLALCVVLLRLGAPTTATCRTDIAPR